MFSSGPIFLPLLLAGVHKSFVFFPLFFSSLFNSAQGGMEPKCGSDLAVISMFTDRSQVCNANAVSVPPTEGELDLCQGGLFLSAAFASSRR